MKLSGFVNIVSFGSHNSVEDLARLDPFSFVRRDNSEIFREFIDKSPHRSRARASRQFRQHHGTAANNELEIEDLLLKAPGPQVVHVHRGVEDRKISCGQSRLASLFRCTA